MNRGAWLLAMDESGPRIRKEENYPGRGSWGFCSSLAFWVVVRSVEGKFADSVGSFVQCQAWNLS